MTDQGDGPLPHDELARELQRAWREQRRRLLAEHGITVRRPRHAGPEPPEPPATAEEWARAIVDVAATNAGGIENVQLVDLLALVAAYLADVDADHAEAALPLRGADFDHALAAELRHREAELDGQ
jgi:hypothetical protein